MKKIMLVLTVLASLALTSTAVFADGGRNVVEGILQNMDNGHYVVRDEKGKIHTYKYDEKTRKRGGNIKVGDPVELYIHDKRVSMIELLR